MTHINSHVGTITHQGVELFERLKGFEICSLVGGSVPLGVGFEFQKFMADLDSLDLSVYKDVYPSYCFTVLICLPQCSSPRS